MHHPFVCLWKFNSCILRIACMHAQVFETEQKKHMNRYRNMTLHKCQQMSNLNPFSFCIDSLKIIFEIYIIYITFYEAQWKHSAWAFTIATTPPIINFSHFNTSFLSFALRTFAQLLSVYRLFDVMWMLEGQTWMLEEFAHFYTDWQKS